MHAPEISADNSPAVGHQSCTMITGTDAEKTQCCSSQLERSLNHAALAQRAQEAYTRGRTRAHKNGRSTDGCVDLDPAGRRIHCLGRVKDGRPRTGADGKVDAHTHRALSDHGRDHHLLANQVLQTDRPRRGVGAKVQKERAHQRPPALDNVRHQLLPQIVPRGVHGRKPAVAESGGRMKENKWGRFMIS